MPKSKNSPTAFGDLMECVNALVITEAERLTLMECIRELLREHRLSTPRTFR